MSRTSVRVVPVSDPVNRRDRTLRFESQPFEAFHSAWGQSVQDDLEAWRLGHARLCSWQTLLPEPAKFSPPAKFIRNSQPYDRVVKFPAVPAEDGLDEEAQSPVRATGNLGPVTALGTLKPI